MSRILIIALFAFTVSFCPVLSQASSTNNCPIPNLFDPTSPPPFWTWQSNATLTPKRFDPQKKYQFYAMYYFNDETSPFFKRALCHYVANEPNCTPNTCPSFLLVSNKTFTPPLQAAPWDANLPSQPPNSLACHRGDWRINSNSVLECILTNP